jgi:cell division protein FtsB
MTEQEAMNEFTRLHREILALKDENASLKRRVDDLEGKRQSEEEASAGRRARNEASR